MPRRPRRPYSKSAICALSTPIVVSSSAAWARFFSMTAGAACQVDQATHDDEDLEAGVCHGDGVGGLVLALGDRELGHATHATDEVGLGGQHAGVVGGAAHGAVELGLGRQAIAGAGRAHGGDHALGQLEVVLGGLVDELGSAVSRTKTRLRWTCRRSSPSPSSRRPLHSSMYQSQTSFQKNDWTSRA